MENNFNLFPGRGRASYMSFEGVITNIDVAAGNGGRYDGCAQVVTVENEAGGTVNFFMNADTYVVDFTTLYESLPVTVFYNGNAAAPLIYPPQFVAAVVAPAMEGRNIAVGYFNNVLLASDQSLKLNIAPTTEVVTANNQTFMGSPGNHVLIVLYSQTTRSIPPQTTPEKIIVLCGQ